MNRVLIGPANHAGQAAAWAAALRTAGHDAVSFAFRQRPRVPGGGTPGYGFPSDQRLPFPKLTTAVGRRRRAARLARDSSHLLLDGFVPVLGSVRKGLTQVELEQIGSWGIRLGLVAHGSDVRDPIKHAERHPGSYFPLLEPSFREWLTLRSTSNRALVRESGLPVFVSTPDLLLDLPGAVWIPLCVDPDPWVAPPRTRRERPRVLHVPTSPMKGSDVIDPVLQRLHANRLIEYVRPSGVAHRHMPGLVASVDIVVDQIRSGSYGVTTVEAMMSRALVVGHVSRRVRDLLPADPGIVDAEPLTFAETMGRLLDDRQSWPEAAARSHEYARRWHGGEESAHALSGFVSAG